MFEIVIILIFYAYAGFFDFVTKEVTKQTLIQEYGTEYYYQNYSKLIPAVMRHSNEWWVWISLIWAIPILIISLTYDWRFLSAFIIFYSEDIFYYIFTKIKFGSFTPKELPWLHGNISWYKKLVGDKFPRKNFYIVYILQIILFIA